MTQDLVRVKHDITRAFSMCDSCDKTFPSVYSICMKCNGRLRYEGKVAQADSDKPFTIPIQNVWRTEYLIDRLRLHLSVVEEVHGDNIRVRKYLAQAYDLMYKIPIFRPVPAFVINLNDLPENLVKELESCTKRGLEYVIKSAVGRIFEVINLDYYTISVARSLVVKIET